MYSKNYFGVMNVSYDETRKCYKEKFIAIGRMLCPDGFLNANLTFFFELGELKNVKSALEPELFQCRECFNIKITDFALCFFMVLDLRLKIVGCRETADFFFLYGR